MTTALLMKLEWPTMSPDLNPIEHMWGILKWKVVKHHVSNIQKLRDVIMEEWKSLEQLWRNLFSSGECDQIKSNHFYCHITTAQVPWWVKFLWACSRQCRKTTDNLHMDRQCKKNNKQFTYGQTVQKNCTGAFTVLQTVQKEKQQQFTYGQTVQKKQQTIYSLHMDRQCKKATAIYIWTVHIYRLYRRQCAKYTYLYSVRLVYYKDILNYQRHIIHRMGTSTLCTVSIHNVVYT